MQRIYKYPVVVVDRTSFKLPGLIRCLDIEEQGGTVYIWALFDDTIKEEREIKLRIIGTGHEIPDAICMDWRYWKTIHCKNVRLVLHVFVDMGHLVGHGV